MSAMPVVLILYLILAAIPLYALYLLIKALRIYIRKNSWLWGIKPFGGYYE